MVAKDTRIAKMTKRLSSHFFKALVLSSMLAWSSMQDTSTVSGGEEMEKQNERNLRLGSSIRRRGIITVVRRVDSNRLRLKQVPGLQGWAVAPLKRMPIDCLEIRDEHFPI